MQLDRRLLVAAVVFAATLLVVGGGGAFTDQQSVESNPSYVPVTNETWLWPYTSTSQGFRDRTLAINVIIYGDPDMVERHFREQAAGDWNETVTEEADVDPVERAPNGTSIAWGTAAGATRYVYVQPKEEPGVWYAADYQLHDGDYFGSRHHVRAYKSPYDEQWVALQAHREHWDWFRLRHTVDGVRAAQAHVEREFMGRWFVESISREFVTSPQEDNIEGWVTVIEFGSPPGGAGAALVLVGVPALWRLNRYAAEGRERVAAHVSEPTWRPVLLAGALGGLYLAVRFAGIGLHQLLPSVHPYVIAGLLYPVLFVGLPACAAGFARRVDRLEAFAGGTLGFATAVFLDYTYLQVTVLPISTLVHRLTVAVALGLIAAGAPRPGEKIGVDHQYFRLGLLLWLVALGLPMVRFV